jgi:hypothetical protein
MDWHHIPYTHPQEGHYLRTRQDMKQIITGPFGRVAYHNAGGVGRNQYPTLNIPCSTFARGEMMQPANKSHAPNVIQLRSRAAMVMFGAPIKRKN